MKEKQSMKEDSLKKDQDQNTYKYQISLVPELGTRAIRVKVTDGDLKGKSALVIKMPDQFSGFFPELSGFFHEK